MVAVAPFLLLWALFPVAVIVINRPAKSWRGGILTADDRRFLRTAARRTWRYFDDFVGPQTFWLPPDNVQETPKREIFLRTSPTNIGLWMLATVAANDFGYITIDDFVARNLGTLETVGRLKRFEGHLFNWYDLSTLEPLHPRYVSTVDSGNLLASLWTFETSCDELATRPLLDASALRGIADTLGVMRQIAATIKEAEHPPAFLRLVELTTSQPANLEEVILRLRAARSPAQDLLLFFHGPETDPRAYWAQQVAKQVAAWNAVIDKYFRPVEILMAPPSQLMSLGEAAHERRRDALAATFSLRNIATEGIPGLVPLLAFHGQREEPELPQPVRQWFDFLVTEAERSRQGASEQLAQLDELIAQSQQLESGMGLRFLYDEERRIFAIGYQVAQRRLDTSFYDLLASEARLTSFLAIARGEVPVEHWWALSRPFGSAYGRLPVLSWSGTMFEYLMPLLFTQTHENSLLDRACYDAVRCQIAYAQQNSVPWGISESAFSALDRHNVYQYRAFGVPALALRRGQDQDLVVAPYAAALALGVEPAAAIKNLRRLATLGNSELFNDYGYCEAIDYSRRTEPGGAAGIIIHCYMVHHQGMSLLAYDNALHNNTMRRRTNFADYWRGARRATPASNDSDPWQRGRHANTRFRVAACSPPLQRDLLSYGDEFRRRLLALVGPGHHALARRHDLRCAGRNLLYPGFGERHNLEQHSSTGAKSREPIHLELHARQSGVPAEKRAVRDVYRNCRLRRRRRRSPAHDFGQHLAQIVPSGADYLHRTRSRTAPGRSRASCFQQALHRNRMASILRSPARPSSPPRSRRTADLGRASLGTRVFVLHRHD